MKIYLKDNVLDAAVKRIRWLYDEFKNVIIGISGGKDSTVLYHLCLDIAREKKRLPMPVMFVDQEAEWQSTVDHVTDLMENVDIFPMWFQIPIKIFNAASTHDHWLNCWDPTEREKWIHPQKEYAYTEDRYRTKRFASIFKSILRVEFPRQSTCYISGVRAEESPSRYMAMTERPTYKGVCWALRLNKTMPHYTFYPIYDWSYNDIWKFIYDNKLSYNRHYDRLYKYGVPINNMRVSNIHHETAVRSLFILQEFEPKTYERLTQRIGGADTAGKLGGDDYFVYELPFMFSSWREYRDYLLEHLIDNERWKAKLRKQFIKHENRFNECVYEQMYKVHISSILTNDWECIKLKNWYWRPLSKEQIKREIRTDKPRSLDTDREGTREQLQS